MKVVYDLSVSSKEAEALEKLMKGELTLESAQIKYNKKIATALITYEALVRASCQEKFDLLMTFYLNASTAGIVETESDFYHEAMNVLSGLSVRELTVLYHLDNYQYKVKHWDEINYKPELYVSSEAKINKDEVLAIFHKLLGSGLVIQCPLMGGVVRIYTSPNYKRIKDLVLTMYES